MNNFLENLQKKPLKTRKKIMWISVFSFTLIIFLFWLFLAPHNSSNNNKDTSSLNLNKFKEEIKERVSESGINNISGEIKEAAKEFNSVDSKESELKTNEEPRLPLEIENL